MSKGGVVFNMFYLIKSSFDANKKSNIVLLLLFIIVTIVKLEAGLIVALYIIIKIGKSTSDYNYFCDVKRMMRTFPNSENIYAKYCILNNNWICLLILIIWVMIGAFKSDYMINELLYYVLIIYIIGSLYRYMYDLSEINGRTSFIENIRKTLFILIAITFIFISRTPGVYKTVNSLIFKYNQVKLIISTIILIFINIIFYFLFSKALNKNTSIS